MWWLSHVKSSLSWQPTSRGTTRYSQNLMAQVGFRVRASGDVPSCSPRPFRSTWRPRHDHSPPRRPCILSGERISMATYMGISYDFMWQNQCHMAIYIIYLPFGDDLIRIYGHSGDGNYGLGFIVCRMNRQELGMFLFQKKMMVGWWFCFGWC